MNAVIATLGYILSEDGSHVLLIHRDKNLQDNQYGKFNGLGGKLEDDEDVVQGMRREIREEAGIECQEMHLVGTISWPGAGPDGEHWFGFIFIIPRWTGTPRTSNQEGSLIWVDIADVLNQTVPLWDGDRHFLPLVFAGEGQFHGVMPYHDGRSQGWSYSMLEWRHNCVSTK